MPELANCAILTILLPAQETRGGVQRFIAPRLKHEFVLSLSVCIPSCDSVSTFPHLSGDVLSLYTRHRPIPMRNSITVADRSFNLGPFMLQHLHIAAPVIDRQGHVPEARQCVS